MSTDETAILDYLKQFPHTYLSVSEIARRAGNRKRFVAEPDWPRIHLRRLELARYVESNPFGQFKYVRPNARKTDRPDPDADTASDPAGEATSEQPPADSPQADSNRPSLDFTQ